MIKPNEVIRELKSISYNVNKIAKETGYLEYGDLSYLDVKEQDAEGTFLRMEIEEIFQNLEKIQNKINYLTLPIKCEGALFKNEEGRYEIESGDYYSSGSLIEYLSYDERYDEYPYWKKSRVEHNGEDYYIVGAPDLSMNGVSVRVRRFE
ncbi:MAG: DUF5348 domain-containing protein [Dysgonomonas sp.]